LLYNPDATPDVWRRSLSRQFGDKAAAAERALSSVSRVLPLLTSAHLPSASNHSLWYEMYTNQPIVEGGAPYPYSDTPQPRVFAYTSPLDPQLFSTIAEHAVDLLEARANPKYSPADVAAWLDGFASEGQAGLGELGAPGDARARRLIEDTAIQMGIARFFAAKLRAGLLYALWQKNSDPALGAAALEQYRSARAVWAAMAARAASVYVSDVSYGAIPQRRGHWSDRLAAMDADIAAMAKTVALTKAAITPSGNLSQLVQQPPARPATTGRHLAPEHFTPGADLPLVLTGAGGGQLFYRHVNHGERWQSLAMSQEGDSLRAAIPGDYTRSPYPLQYYFALSRGGQAWMSPGFNASLSNQPYFAVWKRG
jgi:hypothetical protein